MTQCHTHLKFNYHLNHHPLIDIRLLLITNNNIKRCSCYANNGTRNDIVSINLIQKEVHEYHQCLLEGQQ